MVMVEWLQRLGLYQLISRFIISGLSEKSSIKTEKIDMKIEYCLPPQGAGYRAVTRRAAV